MPRLSKIGAAALGAFGWTSGASAVTATYLQVAGGGAGGVNSAGGGGAGGYLTGTTTLNPTLSYTVIVGAGGTGAVNGGPVSTNGSNSQFGTLTASIGGGRGGAYYSVAASGGSGGGGGYTPNDAGAAGTSGQGNAGGTGAVAGFGGGGGAGAVGGSVAGGNSGAGGVGLTSSISGTSTYYAGGGGGGNGTAGQQGAGGLGGGGAGAAGNNISGTSGTANTGGGGGGTGGGGSAYYGGNGGSGVVIISYAGAQQFGGGVVTSSGGNTIHTFNTSGTLAPLSSLSASYLIVAGGAGGGSGNYGGGGGAGGYQTGSGLTIDTNSTYVVTVGAGGIAGTYASGGTGIGGNGGNSLLSSVVASTGGGGGGGGNATGSIGSNGGSGGGGAGVGNYAGGTGVSGQGFAGASGTSNTTGGGGGGSSAAGSSKNGGNGTASSISGTSVIYAGGGAAFAASGGGTAGTGGGGAVNTSGTANTGGGGGADNGSGAGAGGSGIVIISYAGATQQMAGGTVTISGGNVIHTFTSSGYLTPLKFVNNSLRFRSSASAYLNRTPTVAGNRKTWTLSAWVKRGKLSSINTILNANYSTVPWFVVNFGSDDTLQIAATAGSSASWKTAAVFRDPAAWYHVVAVVDTTSATTTITSTSTDRMRLYVNGVQYALTSGTVPTQNSDLQVNNTISHTIGGYSGEYYDGEMTEVNLIDGQALTPNSFGTFNSYGVWQPITYGGSYGTNGFYLPFTSTSSYAQQYNGSSQYLGLPANSVFNFGTGNLTAECWFYTTQSSSYQSFIDFWPNISGSYLTGQWQLGTDNANHLSFYLTTSSTSGGNISVISSATFAVNAWNHAAMVRNGSTVTLYLNGLSVATVSVGSNVMGYSSTTGSIGRQTSGSAYMSGYISNARITNTVVYTSSFTPSTKPLTAITGTQLLTLQNATAVDNSTNALTLTNSGGVIAQTYPFAYLNNTVVDFSPAQNNWTANNIGQTTGSTLDTMTDVPTLTSATVANYCVLNPLDWQNTNFPVTDGNLTWTTTTTAGGSSRGTVGMTTGKFYWEILATSVGAGGFGVGVAKNNSAYFGSGQVLYQANNGNKNIDGTSTAYGATWSTGDVIGVAYDADAGSITFYKNNSSQGAFTASGYAGVLVCPVVADGSSLACTMNANFGQQPFTYTPPSGFLALNTYNI